MPQNSALQYEDDNANYLTYIVKYNCACECSINFSCYSFFKYFFDVEYF